MTLDWQSAGHEFDTHRPVCPVEAAHTHSPLSPSSTGVPRWGSKEDSNHIESSDFFALCVWPLFYASIQKSWVHYDNDHFSYVPDPWLTCDHFVGKASAMGQPPGQLSLLPSVGRE